MCSVDLCEIGKVREVVVFFSETAVAFFSFSLNLFVVVN